MTSAKSDQNPETLPNPLRHPSIAAIVVTYNRLSLLQECVASLRAQTRPLDEIIVINNGSTDETGNWLTSQPGLTVVTQANLGGSGGFYTGIKTAFEKGHDWIWCMDDDTIPATDALEKMTQTPCYVQPTTGFVASVVLWTDGLPWGDSHNHASHPSDWFLTVVADRCVRANQSTFVSVLISRTAVAEVGLPFKDFFLLIDDTEYTTRITSRFRGYYALESRVVHKTPQCARTGANDHDPRSIKNSYWIRNNVILTRMRIRGFSGRWLQLILQFLQLVRAVLTRKQPVRALWWFWRGVVHPIRIDRV